MKKSKIKNIVGVWECGKLGRVFHIHTSLCAGKEKLQRPAGIPVGVGSEAGDVSMKAPAAARPYCHLSQKTTFSDKLQKSLVNKKEAVSN